MTNERFFDRERLPLPKKKTNKKMRRKNSFHSYPQDRQDYDIGDLFSDLGNQTIANFFESILVQPKLNVSQAGDIYEQEADRIANEIVNKKTSKKPKFTRMKKKGSSKKLSVDNEIESKIKNLKGKGKPLNKPIREHFEGTFGVDLGNVRVPTGVNPLSGFALKANANNKTISDNSETKIKDLKGKGNPLSKPLRDYFEPRFGVDFGDVRVHTGKEQNLLAEYIHAKAFTKGKDIVFGENQYHPETTDGKKLIAHELTHVIQQEGGQHEVVLRKEEREVKPKKSNKKKGVINKGAKYTFVVSGTTDTSGLMDDDLQMVLSRKYFLTTDDQLDSEGAAGEFAQILDGGTPVFYEWIGDNIMSTNNGKRVSMKSQAEYIYKQIMLIVLNSNEYKEGKKLPINLIGHSHGGNIMVLVANMLMENDDPAEIYNLITLSAPVRQDCQIEDKYCDRINHISLFSFFDFVQNVGFLDQNTYTFAIIGLFTSLFFAALRYFGGMGTHRFKNADKNIDITRYRKLFPRKEYREKIREKVKEIGNEEWEKKYHKSNYAFDAPFYFHQISRSLKFIKEILNKEGLL